MENIIIKNAMKWQYDICIVFINKHHFALKQSLKISFKYEHIILIIDVSIKPLTDEANMQHKKSKQNRHLISVQNSAQKHKI